MTTPTTPSAMEEARNISGKCDHLASYPGPNWRNKACVDCIARALSERDTNMPVLAAGLLTKLKEECERQHARAEAAEAQLREKDSMLDALGKECTKLEEDREYNAGLVHKLERGATRRGAAVKTEGLGNLGRGSRALLQQAQRDALRLKAEVERLRAELERCRIALGSADNGPIPGQLTRRHAPEPEAP